MLVLRLILIALLTAVSALVYVSLPDIQRYLRMRRM